jgi:CBS domain-containing protein
MKISDVMTRDVRTVSPGTPLKEAAAVLARNGISGLPVVDADGVVVGVLSEADILVKESGPPPRHAGLLAWLLEPSDPSLPAKLEARTAGEAMTSPALTIGPGRPVRDAASHMLEDGVNRLPVVDETGRLVGIVTRADLVRAFTRSDEEIREEIESDVLRRTLWINDPAAIRVTVEGGAVTLAGSVPTATDAELLPRFVQRVPGVVGVTSELTHEEL